VTDREDALRRLAAAMDIPMEILNMGSAHFGNYLEGYREELVEVFEEAVQVLGELTREFVTTPPGVYTEADNEGNS
jgi:hypothetical protein